ncbi:MAG: ATP-binding protein [Anaerovoracaceae bacterium]|jgi:predicted AAA+ superfamily ATPase
MKYDMKSLSIYGKASKYKAMENIGEILRLADLYKLKGDLWQSFIALLLIMDENPFTMSWELKEGEKGTLSSYAKKDMGLLREVFFSDPYLMGNYMVTAPYKETSSSRIGVLASDLAAKLAGTDCEKGFLDELTTFYKEQGVGILGLYKAFYVADTMEEGNANEVLIPVEEFDPVRLEDLWGYEAQKKLLVENTGAFIKGQPANNVLLYGDSGTGKSTSVKALLNEYFEQGLRMIALYKHQMDKLYRIINLTKNRNYRFIIYMDDLSFEDFETEYKYLKAIIEGSLEPKPANLLIYATSNRRHLIREVWSDREDMNDYEVHRSDTMQEKLSLADRFGLTINYSKPNQRDYYQIVLHLAKREGIHLSEKELLEGAKSWSIMHGGMSGRVAVQYINSILGKDGYR